MQILPWRSGDRAAPARLDFAPRVGFAYRHQRRTVVHGGYGKYFTQLENDAAHQSNLQHQTHHSGGRSTTAAPDFAINPVNGRVPDRRAGAGALCTSAAPLATDLHPPRDHARRSRRTIHNDTYSHQAIGRRAASDRCGARGRSELRLHRPAPGRSDLQQNLTYDPATGDNIPFSIIASRVVPGLGIRQRRVHAGMVATTTRSKRRSTSASAITGSCPPTTRSARSRIRQGDPARSSRDPTERPTARRSRSS